jgi:hypothetical protein
LSVSSQKYGVGIRDPEKIYSGSRVQGSKRNRIPDPGSATLQKFSVEFFGLKDAIYFIVELYE